MRISIDSFSGALPSIAKNKLPDGYASVAENAQLTGGQLRAFRDIEQDATLANSNISTVYRWGRSQGGLGKWLEFELFTHVARGFINSDTTERTYYVDHLGAFGLRQVDLNLIGSNAPFPENYLDVGVPAPTTAIFPIVIGTLPDNDPDTLLEVEKRFYVYTFVNAQGEEGPQSPLSIGVNVHPTSQVVTLTNFTGFPSSGNYDITSIRIYRTETIADGSADFYFVAEIPKTQTTFSDNILEEDLQGGTLITSAYEPPPSGATGLISLPNGVMALFKGNTLYFSEPYLPYAWPADYQVVLDHDMVAIGHFDNTVVAITTEDVYVINGFDPRQLTPVKLNINQSCVSKRSVVSMSSAGVAFASPDGLILIGNNGVSNITQGVFSREDWQNLNPSSMHSYYYNGRYLTFYDNGDIQKGFAVSVSGSQAGLIEFDFYANSAFIDTVDDQLYLVFNGNELHKFDASTTDRLAYRYLSKAYELPYNMRLPFIKVVADGYCDITATIYIDGKESATQPIRSDKPYFLSRRKGQKYQIELKGTSPISMVTLASTREEAL